MEIIVHKTSLKDKTGERVHFEKPYFDTAFRREFHSAEEKHAFMNSINAVNTGDSDAKYKKELKQANEKKMDERRK